MPRTLLRAGSPEAEDRARRMLVAYVRDDLTLAQIGALHGTTGERARQIMNERDFALYRLARRRRLARARLKTFVFRGHAPHLVDCRLCGETFQDVERGQGRGKPAVFCCNTHSAAWAALRPHLAKFEGDHQRYTAISIVRAAEEGKPWAKETNTKAARRLLAGETESRGKWLVPGSLNWHWCIRAYALGWPLFDELHPDIQRQIKESVEG